MRRLKAELHRPIDVVVRNVRPRSSRQEGLAGTLKEQDGRWSSPVTREARCKPPEDGQ